MRVDIPSLKSKFLETYYRDRRRPLADIAAVELEHRFPMIDRMRGVARLALHAALPMAERFLDFVDLPRLSPQSTRQLWPAISYRQVAQTQWSEGTVFLVGDAFTSLFDVEAQLDVARGLTALGYRPVFASVPPGAKAAFNLGMRERFVRAATRQAKALSMLASAGHPMVGIDPAFILMLRQEYAELEMGTPHVLLPQEFLLNEIRAGRSRPCLKAPAGASTILLHCTEASALAGAADQWRAVFDALSIPVAVESPGCCGMAGMFGHMRRHQAVSRTLFENWKPLCSSGTSSWATGFSCRTQIRRLSQQVARHPFGLIADAAD